MRHLSLCTDPNALTTVFEYDFLNRHIKVTDPLGRSTESAYNLVGELLKAKRLRMETMKKEIAFCVDHV